MSDDKILFGILDEQDSVTEEGTHDNPSDEKIYPKSDNVHQG